MSIEILGVLFHKNVSEISPGGGSPFELETVGALARAFDENDFDRVLILQNSFAADPLPIATYAAAITRRLSFMIAHRPGFVAPTMAARMFATLDHLSQGRAGVHIITASNDVETRCDGDYLTKEERYRRSREYVEVMRRMWNATEPVDFKGDFYRFDRALGELRPYDGSIPIYWGGASPSALKFAGECADVYAMGGLQPVAEMREFARRVQDAAAKAGRRLKLQASVRLIMGDTEEAAWKQAEGIVESLRAIAEEQRLARESGKTVTRPGMRIDDTLATGKDGEGVANIRAFVAGRDLLDKRLWTGATKATATFSTPMIPPVLVGTPEQIADALGDYYDMGITGFMLRGFDLLGDIPVMGRELNPLLRRMAEERAPGSLVA
ncbi:MAG: LLM class flavin-dependent oxidoreductase [Sphingobium sp.]